MTSKMLRMCLKATVALAALAAVVALAPVSLADARPEESSFAGTYAWGDRAVTISGKGQIKGSFGTSNYCKGTISGQGPKYIKETYKYAGNMAFDANGNIVGTPGTRGSFVWVRP